MLFYFDPASFILRIMIVLNVCVYFKEMAMQIGGWIMKHHSIKDNKTKAKLKGKILIAFNGAQNHACLNKII